MEHLGQRAQTILNTIIAEYIANGEPVGSRTVSKMKDVELSAASIRNIMGDLTDQGYITQPHVSAGRVPTDRGYRFYVDSIFANGWPASNDHGSAIESLIRAAGIDIRDIMRQSSLVLADLSRKAGVVTASGAGDQRFKTIEFIKVADDRILVVLVSNRGFVQNKVIYDEDGINQETLEQYSRRLSDMLKDLDLREARERIERELDREKTRVDALLAKTLRLGQTILSQEPEGEIFIEGQTNILDEPEFLKIEQLKALLVTFEEKSKLLKILDKTLKARGIQVFIGSEHGLDEIETCSIVAFPILAGESALGSIGVIGPKRMNYPQVVSLVDTTGRILTRLLQKILENTM